MKVCKGSLAHVRILVNYVSRTLGRLLLCPHEIVTFGGSLMSAVGGGLSFRVSDCLGEKYLLIFPQFQTVSYGSTVDGGVEVGA